MDPTTSDPDEKAALELLENLIEKYSTDVLSWLAFSLIRGDLPPYPSPWGRRATKLIHTRDKIVADSTRGM